MGRRRITSANLDPAPGAGVAFVWLPRRSSALTFPVRSAAARRTPPACRPGYSTFLAPGSRRGPEVGEIEA
ncbi:MAG: hypothetical protein OXG81_06480 [Acidobacteria bacterium]|nr:hypothetical protein [Acidobacteriota bacterium]